MLSLVSVRCVALAVLAGAALVASPVRGLACTGDCNGDGAVLVAELINGVNIALGRTDVGQCAACDSNRDGTVTINELIEAVRAALNGCPATPTASPSGTATATPSAPPTATSPAPPTATASPTETPTMQRCDTDGIICTVAGTGNAQFDGDGRDALDTSFYFPIQVVFDRDGQPLILDWNNLRLRRINQDGTVSTIMGNGFEALPTEGALAIDTPLHHASDIKFDTAGRLYVAGDHVSVVFRVDTDQRVYTVAGDCVTQPDDCYGYSGDHGPALEAQLGVPVGVLPDTANGFYIADVDTDTIRYVDAHGVITTVAGTGVEGYSGDGHPATEGQLADPRRMTFGPDGAIYFAESKNHVIRRIRTDGVLETVAGTGARGYGGDNGPARQATLNAPYDIVFAPNGDAYVADTNNNAIRRIDTGGTISTVIGTGDAGFSGDHGPAAQATLRRPQAVIFDSAGSLWISDTSNQRVRRVWHYLAP